MTLTVSQLVLRARQLEIDSIRHLRQRIGLVDALGQLIDCLQRERGATSIYLASGRQQFVQERQEALQATRVQENLLREAMARYHASSATSQPQLLSLMAWVLHDLDALDALREQFSQQAVGAHEVIVAFSRLIGGQIELIFHLADSAMYPKVSRQLVALVHLLQGKEFAGQERALGGQLFASGLMQEAPQQRLVHLIEAQERSLQVFEEFVNPALREHWQRFQVSPQVAQLERLRRTLCTYRPQGQLDAKLINPWFAATSDRIAEMRQLEAGLVQSLHAYCDTKERAFEQELQDTEGLLEQLHQNPPPHSHAVERFFNAAVQPDAVPVLNPVSPEDRVADRVAAPVGTQTAPSDEQVSSMVELLQAQSARLASMEVELEAARRALHERKVVERAKGALMSRLGMTEEAAFRALQKTAMDHNKRLVDVAEAALALPATETLRR